MSNGLIFSSAAERTSNIIETNRCRQHTENENSDGKVIGFVGGPGAGKGYIMRMLRKKYPDIQFLYKVTTRNPRATDHEEGVVALPNDIFDAQIEHIIGVHKPFGDDDPRRYGWWVNGAMHGINDGAHYIADPNIALINEFRERFASRLHLIGLTAKPDYLEENMINRRLEERLRQKESTQLSTEDLEDIKRRVEVGIETTRQVQEAYATGQIDSLITVGPNNREHLIELVLDDLKANTRFFSPEGNSPIIESSIMHHPFETINLYRPRMEKL